jgi:hypothetical protein
MPGLGFLVARARKGAGRKAPNPHALHPFLEEGLDPNKISGVGTVFGLRTSSCTSGTE